MGFSSTFADAVLNGDDDALDLVLAGPLIVDRNNFVERPWGGTRIREYKRMHPLPDQPSATGLGIGEAFELAAFDDDEEAARHPSRVTFADGSAVSLPTLLGRHGRRVLGDAFVERYGTCLPLLPKTLDVRELLSVQGHPAGHTEAYIVIDAEPGATIALGFNADIDADAWRDRLRLGLTRQADLAGMLAEDADLLALHNRAAAWFAARDATAGADAGVLGDALAPGADPAAAADLLDALKSHYWEVLDALNHLPVEPGQVIYNATPPRLLGGGSPAAEVHALGNPAGREIVALEVRLPGPTFRAWDNVRFPQREVDVDAAIAALNLRATRPEEFICREIPDPRRAGVSTSVDCEYFRIDHFRPTQGVSCLLPPGGPQCLHVLSGAVALAGMDGREPVVLDRGDSALVPAGHGGFHVGVREGNAHVVVVTLPCD